MADDKDIPTLTLAVLRDIREDMRGMREDIRGMREEQRETNVRLEQANELHDREAALLAERTMAILERSRLLVRRTRSLDTHTEQLDVQGRATLKLLDEARITNERIEHFVRGVHEKDRDDLRARVARLEMHVFRSPTP